MTILNFPVIRRFEIVMKENYEGLNVPRLVEVTDSKDPRDGVRIEEIEQFAYDGEFGPYTARLLGEIGRARKGETFEGNPLD